MGGRPRTGRARRDPTTHRAVSHDTRGPALGRSDDRSATLHGVRLLPLRPHRRSHRREPGPVRAAPERAPERQRWHGPRRSSARSCSRLNGSTTAHAALAVLLGLNGLRVSRSMRDKHRRPRASNAGTVRFGSSAKATSPRRFCSFRAPRGPSTSLIGELHEGPILRRRDGERLDRRTAHRWVRCDRQTRGPRCRPSAHARAGFIMAALDAGVPLATYRSPPDTPTHERRRSTTDAARTSTATPPTLLSRSSPADNARRPRSALLG